MQSSFLRRTLPRSIIALAILGLGVFLSRGGSDANATFIGSAATTLSSVAASANADTTVALSIPMNDYNFSAVMNGTPSAAVIAKGPGYPGYSSLTEPALGDVMGTLASSSTLGLIGSPCTTLLSPPFTFLNATVDNSAANTIDAVPQGMTNTGSQGTLDNMWSDNGASVGGPGAVAPWNSFWGDGLLHGGADDGSRGLSLPERTNGLPAQVDRYPSYLNILFDPDYPATPGTNAVQPQARYAGASLVASTAVILDLVIFAPGALSGAGFGTNHPFSLTSTSGYTSIAVLNDSTVAASHGSISDFCTPLLTTAVTYGVAKANPCLGIGGTGVCITGPQISAPVAGADTKVRYANPAAGYYFWMSTLQSQRDADGDGTENALDACPTTADTYNPRAPVVAQDLDSDGLPNACDPNNGDFNNDYDGDGWENSYDNCPLLSNILQTDSELTIAYATTAPAGGPRGDSMGDDCDADDVVSNGAFLTSRTNSCINIGGAADNDSVDGDGYTNSVECTIGTMGNLRCTAVTGPNPNWPSDLSSSSFNKITLSDATSFTSPAPRKFGTVPGQAGYNARWDIKSPFNTIVLGDVTTLTSGLDGSPNKPPMFGVGVRAFNGPTCTP